MSFFCNFPEIAEVVSNCFQVKKMPNLLTSNKSCFNLALLLTKNPKILVQQNQASPNCHASWIMSQRPHKMYVRFGMTYADLTRKLRQPMRTRHLHMSTSPLNCLTSYCTAYGVPWPPVSYERSGLSPHVSISVHTKVSIVASAFDTRVVTVRVYGQAIHRYPNSYSSVIILIGIEQVIKSRICVMNE